MKIKVKIIGISQPPTGFGSQKEVPLEFSGNSIRDLVPQLLSTMDPETRNILIAGRDEIPPDLPIIFNGIVDSYSVLSDFRLKDGDLVELIPSSG